jgi:hypothetical protein
VRQLIRVSFKLNRNKVPPDDKTLLLEFGTSVLSLAPFNVEWKVRML